MLKSQEIKAQGCFKLSIKRVFTIFLTVVLFQLCQFPYVNLNNIQIQEKPVSVVSLDKKVFKEPVKIADFPQNIAMGSMITGEAVLGFTLGEILVTIAIVGAIAALTIPPLIQNIQNQQFKTAYVKAFADASNALLSANNDGLLVSQPGWTNDPSNNYNFDQFQSKFDVIKTCTSANKSQCWAPNNESATVWFSCPVSYATGGLFIDKQGRSWSDSNNYGYILVDVNGLNGPNQWGHDRFPFFVEVNNQWNTAGVPNTIAPWLTDYTSVDANRCATPPCYYQSWLTGAK